MSNGDGSGTAGATGTTEGKGSPTFGSALLRARQRADLSQAALGSIVGIPQSTVSSWERGESEPPAAMVFSIEQALRLEPGTLSYHLGYTPLGVAEPCNIEIAVNSDTHLDLYKKNLLLSIYETMRMT